MDERCLVAADGIKGGVSMAKSKRSNEVPTPAMAFEHKPDEYQLGADPGHGIPGDDYSAISIWKIPMRPSSPYIQIETKMRIVIAGVGGDAPIFPLHSN